jgi:hypothetical protein
MNISKETSYVKLKDNLPKTVQLFEQKYPKNHTDISYLKHLSQLFTRQKFDDNKLSEIAINPKSVLTLNLALSIEEEKKKDPSFDDKFYSELESRLKAFKENKGKTEPTPSKVLDEKTNPEVLFKQALEQKNVMALFLDASDKALKTPIQTRIADLAKLAKNIDLKKESLTSGYQLASETLTVLKMVEIQLADLPEEHRDTVDTETVEQVNHYILTGEFKKAKKGIKNAMQPAPEENNQATNQTVIEIIELDERNNPPNANNEVAIIEQNLPRTTFTETNQALLHRIFRTLRVLNTPEGLRALVGRVPGRILMVGTLTAILAGVTIILNHALSYALMAALDVTGQQGNNILNNPASYGWSVALTVIYTLISFGMVVRTALQTWAQHTTTSGFQWFGNIARICVCVASMFSVLASVVHNIQTREITLEGMIVIVNFIAVIVGHILPRRIIEGVLIRINPLAGQINVMGSAAVSVIMAIVFMPTIFVLGLGGPQLYANRNTAPFLDNLAGRINLDIGAGNILRGALGFTATEILGPLFMSILLNINSVRDLGRNLRDTWNRLIANGYPDNAPLRQRVLAYFDFHRVGRHTPTEEEQNNNQANANVPANTTPNYIEVGPVGGNLQTGLAHAANEAVNTAMLFQTMLGVGAIIFVGATGLGAPTVSPWLSSFVLAVCIGCSLFFLLCTGIARENNPNPAPAQNQ